MFPIGAGSNPRLQASHVRGKNHGNKLKDKPAQGDECIQRITLLTRYNPLKLQEGSFLHDLA